MLRLYALALFFFTANAVITVIFPLQAADHGFRAGEIGIMMGLYMFVCMVLRPWAGQLIAKYSVLSIMKWLLVGHAFALLLYVWLGVESLYIVRALQGVVTAFFSMAMQIGVVSILSDEDRGQGMSMYSLSTVLPGLYGPALALLLWTQFDHFYLLLFIGSLAVLPLLFIYRSPLPAAREDKGMFTFREMYIAFRDACRHRGLIISSIVMLIGACVFGAITTFLPLYMVSTGYGNAALYLFLQAIVVVISRFLLRRSIPSDGKWHPSFMSFVLGSLVIGTILLAWMPYIGNFIYVSAIFNGLATAMLYPTIITYMTFVIPKESKHILLGIFLASYELGFSLGGFVMGFVIQMSSFTMMFITCSIIGLTAIMFIWGNRKEEFPALDKGALS
ncbi:staphylopine family metallophore export MFS transporter CntE [Sutcliffiella rhizosphaerae]|uniref:Staphylopine export protein n=1 Tax=Sutcliffiella rhizosphaerae TaxID=2880967 RepID=A0ABM8YRX3_9BACI|nr:MFS transporter [Sutcliffiella rhizosphaerae]CAG9622745.1 Staphylopine export protein [Sutcliffiella rhizosphaerae]